MKCSTTRVPRVLKAKEGKRESVLTVVTREQGMIHTCKGIVRTVPELRGAFLKLKEIVDAEGAVIASDNGEPKYHLTFYIGFVFQSDFLMDDLTVYETLEVPLSYRDVQKWDRQSIVCDTLFRFHIGIARVLVARPALIFAGEPAGNLNSDQDRECLYSRRCGVGRSGLEACRRNLSGKHHSCA